MTDSLFGSAFDGRVLHVSQETHAIDLRKFVASVRAAVKELGE